MRITTYTTKMNEDNLNVLVKESAINYKIDNSHMDCACKIAKMMCDVFELHLSAEEFVYLLALNSKCKILGVFEVSHGTFNTSFINPREIMIRNLLCGASTFIIVHNHPSGEFEVSKADLTATKQLINAGELIGIALLDHIIIGRDDNSQHTFYSMREHNMIH